MAENVKITITAFDKTKKSFSSVTGGLKRVTKAVFSMKTALIGAAGIAGIGLLIKNSLTTIDVLAKTATKIGTTTEALSKLHFAADITGVKTETVNMAMQRFTRRLSEATRGTGEAKDALKRLNIDANTLIELPLDEQMLQLADAFSAVGNDAEKVSLAMKLFDSEGVSLVNTLKLGSEGMKELFDEAEMLGLVMSAKAAKGVEEANDALTRLFSIFRGVTHQITAAFAPAIQEITDWLKNKLIIQITETHGSIKKFAQFLVKELLAATSQFVGWIAKQVSFVQTVINEFQIKWEEFSAWLADRPIDETIKLVNFTKAIDALIKMATAIRDFGDNLTFADSKASGLGDTIVKQSEIFTAFENGMKTVKDGFPSLEEGFVKVGQALEENLTQGFTDAVTGAKDFATAMKDMAKSVIDSLIKMLIQYYITKPLFDAITSGFGGGGTTKQTIGRGTGGMGGPTVFEGGGFTGMGSRSGGVDGKGGFNAILHPNETVIDHTKGGGGGVVVNQTINVTTGIQSTVRAEIVQLMPQIAQAAKGAVADARLRGGNFSKAMAGA
jgi:hypothetical protein